MSTLVIVNPNATTVQSHTLTAVIEAFASLGDIRVRTSDARGHITRIAAAALDEDTRLVVVVGGDGTVNEAVNGLLAQGTGPGLPALAVVPAGHTNVFARVLGLPNDAVEATALLVDGVRHDHSRRVTLGSSDGRYFLFSAGLGLDAEVLTRVEQQRAKGVRASVPLYVASALVAHAIANLHARPGITVSFGDRPPISDVYTVIVQNAPVWTYFGSQPVTFSPGASLEGGLGVYGLRSLDPLSVSNHLALAAWRPARLAPESGAMDVEAFTVRSEQPLPFQVDGEVVGERSELRFTAVREALRVVAPLPDAV